MGIMYSFLSWKAAARMLFVSETWLALLSSTHGLNKSENEVSETEQIMTAAAKLVKSEIRARE